MAFALYICILSPTPIELSVPVKLEGDNATSLSHYEIRILEKRLSIAEESICTVYDTVSTSNATKSLNKIR